MKSRDTIYFNQLVELKEGDNTLTLEVKDEKGDSLSKTVTITRKVPKVRQLGSRMSLAVLPFQIKGETSPAGSVVYDNLVDAFIDQNRFNIVSRGEELEAVLRELKLSQTDLVDKKTAVKVGRLVAAEGILTGTVQETQDSIEIYARLINTETSLIMEAKDVWKAVDQKKLNILYLSPGLGDMLNKISGFAKAKKILLITGESQHLKSGAALGAVLRGEKPKILLHGKAAASQGAEFDIRMSRIVERVD